MSSHGTCTELNGIVTCNLGDIPSGINVTITIVLQPTRSGTFINTSTVTTSSIELTPTNNTLILTITVSGTEIPPNPLQGFETECIRVPKLYDWTVSQTQNTFDISIPPECQAKIAEFLATNHGATISIICTVPGWNFKI